MYTHAPTAVGLFNPLSYQDRAVQLAYNNGMNQICFESFKPFSTNASEVWQDSKYICIYMFGLYVQCLTVIQLLSGGLLALIADQPLPSAVKDVVDAVQIPVVSTSIITTDTDSTIVSVAPSEEQLANALSTLIIYNSWTDVVLLTWHESSMYIQAIFFNNLIMITSYHV